MRTRFAELVIDMDSREVRRSGQAMHLTPKAFDLLVYLLERRPHVLTKAQILDRVWPSTFVAESNLASLVKEIRRALGDDARTPRFVRTVHGRGYAFCGETGEGDPLGRSSPPPTGFRLTWSGHEASLVGGENVLGRSRSATVCVDDGSISRRHAVIRVTGTEATIEDCGSKNGTFVGGRRVGEAHPLAGGDRIRLGKVQLRFHVDSLELSTLTATGS